MIWSQCVINMLFGVHTIHNVFLCYMRNKKYNSKSSHGVLLCINSFRNFYNTFLRYIQIECYITGKQAKSQLIIIYVYTGWTSYALKYFDYCHRAFIAVTNDMTKSLTAVNGTCYTKQIEHIIFLLTNHSNTCNELKMTQLNVLYCYTYRFLVLYSQI